MVSELFSMVNFFFKGKYHFISLNSLQDFELYVIDGGVSFL